MHVNLGIQWISFDLSLSLLIGEIVVIKIGLDGLILFFIDGRYL